MSRNFTNEALRRVLNQNFTVSVVPEESGEHFELPERDRFKANYLIGTRPHVLVNDVPGQQLLTECLAVVDELEALQARHANLLMQLARLGKGGAV